MGVVKMLDSGDKLKMDQAHLETVIPALGGLNELMAKCRYDEPV